MTKRLVAIIAMLCILFTACPALATEDEEAFVSPTRDPNAPEYDTEHPEELVSEELVARSYILIERRSGDVVGGMEREPDLLNFPASTTKILTALMVLEAVDDLSQTLTVSPNALDFPDDASMVPFKTGEVVTVRDALYGLLLRSGNDAAIALAEFVSEDVQSFVDLMNEAARMLGCENTSFTNPHGYHNEWHQTTARDLAKIMNAAMENETFREIVRTPTYRMSETNMNPAREITNSNAHILVDNTYYYPASIGGKTGFTSDAGYVLVEAGAQDGVELIAAVMYSGEYSRWPDVSRLLSFGFTQYKSVTPEEIYYYEQMDADGKYVLDSNGKRVQPNVITLQINGFATDDSDIGRLKLDIRPVDATNLLRFTDLNATVDSIIENYTEYSSITWTAEHRAPIQQGQLMGTITFYPSDNAEPAEYELVATRSIDVRTDAPPTLEEIEEQVANDPSPFPPFGWDWVLPPVLGMAGFVLLIRFLIKKLWRGKKDRVKMPKPKNRTFT